METFLPSEIARLVLGYLKQENCLETSKVFMRECPHLREYLAMLHQGREFSTEVLGLSLKMILDEYGNMKLSRRTQATPAITNLWDRYELLGSQLRQAITPNVNPANPTASQLVNSMQSFSRRQGSRNRYKSARTEGGVVVVRSEVAITTANAPPSTPQRGTNSNVGGVSTLPRIFPLPSHAVSVPASSLTGRRSQLPSQREDDLESLVSVCSAMSSSICDEVDRDVMVDQTATNDPGNDRLNRTLTVVDPVLHQESSTPAKIISPTSRSPLSSTQLTTSTPGNIPKTSEQSTAYPAIVGASAAQKKSKPPRRIQPKVIGDGAVLSPIRALTSTSATSCRTTPVTSRSLVSTLGYSCPVTSYSSATSCTYSTVLSSSSIPATTCDSRADALMRMDSVVTCTWNPVTPGPLNPAALSTRTSAVDSIVFTPVMSVNNKSTPFQLFPLGSGDLVSAAAPCSVPSFVSYPTVPSGSCDSVPTTCFNSLPVYPVPFDSCNSGPVTSIASTGFSFIPVTSATVPVTTCNSIPVTSNQVPVTVTSVPAIPCTLDEAQSRETVAPAVMDVLGTPSKRKSCSNFAGSGDGDAVDSQVPRTPGRSRRHLSKEFSSPRDRRKKAQPCKRRTAAEQISAPGCTSAGTSSVLHSDGGASTSDSNPAKSDIPEMDINEMLERLISNQAIAEKIAENINRLTSQNTSRSDPAPNTDDPSNCPGTAPDTSSKALSHHPDLAVESTSISLPFESNHQGQNHSGGPSCQGERNETGGPCHESVVTSFNGDNNGSVNEISGVGNNLTLAEPLGTRSYQERSSVLQERQLERVNLHQSGQTHEETVSDLSCTSLLSLSNLDQMTDDAIRFVFDQLCNDPNLDSICSMTYHHTERTEVDMTSSITNQTTSIHHSHVDVVNYTPITVASSSREVLSTAGGDLQSPVQCAMEPSMPPASASAGFDTRRRYIQVCFPGDGEHPDRIDIVEVIGSGVEISNGQSSPDNRSTIADDSQKLVDSGRETASENPMLLSSQDMSNYLHSSTEVASTLGDGSITVWQIPDQATCANTFDSQSMTSTAIEYFSDCVAPANFPRDVSENGAVQSMDPNLTVRLQMLTIAEGDLGQLRTLVGPSSHEVIQFSNDLSHLEPYPAEVVSNTSSSAMEPAICHKRDKSANDYKPGDLTESGRTLSNSKQKIKHRPGNAMKMPAVELKLDEKTGSYLWSNDSIEKRKHLGFGVPGKIPAISSSQTIAPVRTNPVSTCDVDQLRLACSTGGHSDGSVPVFKATDFGTDCIAISEIPSLPHNLEENLNVGRKNTKRGNLSKKKFRVLNRSRGPSTPSRISTGAITASGTSGPSTPSEVAVDSLSSVGITSVSNPPGRGVDGHFNGSTGPPKVSGSAIGSTGCAGDSFTSTVIAGLPTVSGSAVGLSASTRGSGPCGPTESAKVPSTPTDSATVASNFTRSVIVPSSATSGIPPQNPHCATDERSGLEAKNVPRHESRDVRQTKSAVVYLEQDALPPLMEDKECSDQSLLPAAIPINSVLSASSNNALTNEKLHKSSHRSKKKKKAKRIADSDNDLSGNTDKKVKAHKVHNSLGKQTDKSGKTEKSNPASRGTKNTHRVKIEHKKKHKEPLSSVKQYPDTSDDDDLPIAYLLKSGAFKDLYSKNTEANTKPATETHCPSSTLSETVGAKERHHKKKHKKSDSSVKASNDSSSTQNICKGLGGKVKATKEKQSKELSAVPLGNDRFSVTPSCSLQPSTSDVLSRTVHSSGERDRRCATIAPFSVTSVNNVKSEIVPGYCATLYREKDVSENSAQSASWTNFNNFKIPKLGHSLPGETSASKNDINSSVSMHPSASVATERCKSMELFLADCGTSKTSVKTAGIAPPKSQITSAKTPLLSMPKPRTMFPADSWKPLEHILSDHGTSKTVVGTPGIAPPNSRITSFQKTSIASTSKPRTAPPSKTSSIPPQENSESTARNRKSPTNSTSSKTQKHSFYGRSISLCAAENLTVRKHPPPKSSKTKKTNQAIVAKLPAPSLLSRATKVHTTSTYTMTCSTLLSMPSSIENLIKMAEANNGMVSCNDEQMQSVTETEHLEMSTLRRPNLPVASVPLESDDGGYDDVDVASALLSLSSSIPGDSGFAIVPQNVRSTHCNPSTETASACIENSETAIEVCDDPSLHYKSLHDNGKTNLTNSNPVVASSQRQKDSPSLSQADTACSYESGTIDFTVAARDFNLDGCSTEHLRTSSFSSPSIGLVLNIDEGSKLQSSPSTSTSACPSVAESQTDENPSSWPSEEISKPSRKRSRSSSADSDSKAKRMLRKKLKGLDISAFLKQLHQPKNSD